MFANNLNRNCIQTTTPLWTYRLSFSLRLGYMPWRSLSLLSVILPMSHTWLFPYFCWSSNLPLTWPHWLPGVLAPAQYGFHSLLPITSSHSLPVPQTQIFCLSAPALISPGSLSPLHWPDFFHLFWGRAIVFWNPCLQGLASHSSSLLKFFYNLFFS